MTSCIPTGDGRDITPEDDEHIAWFNLGLRTARAKAKRELKCPQCGISNGTCSCYLVRELTGQSKDSPLAAKYRCDKCGRWGLKPVPQSNPDDIESSHSKTGADIQPNTDSLEGEIRKSLLVFRGWTNEDVAMEHLPAAIAHLTQLFNKYAVETLWEARDAIYSAELSGSQAVLDIDERIRQLGGRR